MKNYVQPVGDRIFYVNEWEGTKGPILAVHGLSGNHTHFQAIAERLSPEYRVIAYDVRGRGNSSAADEDTSIFKHAEDTIDLIEALGLKKPVLVGHSMGAFIVAIAASKYANLAGIVLLDGACELEPDSVEKLEPIIRRLEKTYSSPTEYVKSVEAIYGALGVTWNKYIEANAYYELGQISEGVYKAKADSDKIRKDEQSAHLFDPKAIFPQVKCPAILVTASGSFGPAPLVKEELFDSVKKYLLNLEYYVTACNHATLAFVGQHEKEFGELIDRLKKFLTDLGLKR